MRILATDYDNSLRLSHRVSETAIEKINAFRAEGNAFGIVTGRPVSGILPILHADGIPFDFLIASTGAVTVDARGNTVREHSFPEEVSIGFVTRLTSNVLQNELQQALNPNDPSTVDQVALSLQANVASGTEAYHLLGKMPLDKGIAFQSDLKGLRWSNVQSFFGIQANLNNGTSITPLLYELLEKEFRNQMSIFLNIHNIDIAPKGVSKASALLQLAEDNGWRKQDIFTFGDGMNDLGMLEAFQGAAISSATPALLDRIAITYENIEAYIDHLTR